MTAYHVLHDIRGRGTPYETRCGMSDITWDQVRDAIARLPCIKTTTVASCAQSAEEKHIVIRFPLSSILSCVQNCDPIKECQPLRIVFYSAVHLCPESHSCQRLSHRLSVVCSFRAGVLNKGVPGGKHLHLRGTLRSLAVSSGGSLRGDEGQEWSANTLSHTQAGTSWPIPRSCKPF